METGTKKSVRTSRWLGAIMVLIFLVLAIAFLPSHEGNRKAANESLAASSLRALSRANVAYEQDHLQQGYARKLSDLSQRSGNPEGGNYREWMIDPVLAGGEKGGYKFTYSSQSTKGDGKLDAYQVFADPLVPGKTGNRHFFVDETGVVRTSSTGPANATSAVLE